MSTNPELRDVIIVGGGHNGLVCASYLARAGLDVLVLEARDIVGGACVTEELFPGCRMSTYSYVTHLLQPRIVHDLGLESRGFSVLHSDMKRFFPWPGHRAFRWWADGQRTEAEITAAFGADEARGFMQLMVLFKQAAAVFSRFVFAEPPTIAQIFASVRDAEEERVLRLFWEQTPQEIMAPLLRSDELQAAAIGHIIDPRGLDEPGVFFDYSAGTKLNQFVDPRHQGIVVGGMGALSGAMARAARDFGAEIRCGTEVRQVLV
ncbi:MAG TPA: NAD(P)/FAD-dependent oxidoreductase, partial [Myxococcota bacterium]|nr:NAD(P)/FAD-dependent oxidoreductase [Myxococcota bacterium]